MTSGTALAPTQEGGSATQIGVAENALEIAAHHRLTMHLAPSDSVLGGAGPAVVIPSSFNVPISVSVALMPMTCTEMIIDAASLNEVTASNVHEMNQEAQRGPKATETPTALNKTSRTALENNTHVVVHQCLQGQDGALVGVGPIRSDLAPNVQLGGLVAVARPLEQQIEAVSASQHVVQSNTVPILDALHSHSLQYAVPSAPGADKQVPTRHEETAPPVLEDSLRRRRGRPSKSAWSERQGAGVGNKGPLGVRTTEFVAGLAEVSASPATSTRIYREDSIPSASAPSLGSSAEQGGSGVGGAVDVHLSVLQHGQRVSLSPQGGNVAEQVPPIPKPAQQVSQAVLTGPTVPASSEVGEGTSVSLDNSTTQKRVPHQTGVQTLEWDSHEFHPPAGAPDDSQVPGGLLAPPGLEINDRRRNAMEWGFSSTSTATGSAGQAWPSTAAQPKPPAPPTTGTGRGPLVSEGHREVLERLLLQNSQSSTTVPPPAVQKEASKLPAESSGSNLADYLDILNNPRNSYQRASAEHQTGTTDAERMGEGANEGEGSEGPVRLVVAPEQLRQSQSNDPHLTVPPSKPQVEAAVLRALPARVSDVQRGVVRTATADAIGARGVDVATCLMISTQTITQEQLRQQQQATTTTQTQTFAVPINNPQGRTQTDLQVHGTSLHSSQVPSTQVHGTQMPGTSRQTGPQSQAASQPQGTSRECQPESQWDQSYQHRGRGDGDWHGTRGRSRPWDRGASGYEDPDGAYEREYETNYYQRGPSPHRGRWRGGGRGKGHSRNWRSSYQHGYGTYDTRSCEPEHNIHPASRFLEFSYVPSFRRGEYPGRAADIGHRERDGTGGMDPSNPAQTAGQYQGEEPVEANDSANLYGTQPAEEAGSERGSQHEWDNRQGNLGAVCAPNNPAFLDRPEDVYPRGSQEYRIIREQRLALAQTDQTEELDPGAMTHSPPESRSMLAAQQAAAGTSPGATQSAAPTQGQLPRTTPLTISTWDQYFASMGGMRDFLSLQPSTLSVPTASTGAIGTTDALARAFQGLGMGPGSVPGAGATTTTMSTSTNITVPAAINIQTPTIATQMSPSAGTGTLNQLAATWPMATAQTTSATQAQSQVPAPTRMVHFLNGSADGAGDGSDPGPDPGGMTLPQGGLGDLSGYPPGTTFQPTLGPAPPASSNAQPGQGQAPPARPVSRRQACPPFPMVSSNPLMYPRQAFAVPTPAPTTTSAPMPQVAAPTNLLAPPMYTSGYSGIGGAAATGASSAGAAQWGSSGVQGTGGMATGAAGGGAGPPGGPPFPNWHAASWGPPVPPRRQPMQVPQAGMVGAVPLQQQGAPQPPGGGPPPSGGGAPPPPPPPPGGGALMQAAGGAPPPVPPQPPQPPFPPAVPQLAIAAALPQNQNGIVNNYFGNPAPCKVSRWKRGTTTTIENWIYQMEIYCEMNRLPQEMWGRVIASQIHGDHFVEIRPFTILAYADFKRALIKKFTRPDVTFAKSNEFDRLRQGATEAIEVFMDRVKLIGREAYPEMAELEFENICVKRFCTGLANTLVASFAAQKAEGETALAVRAATEAAVFNVVQQAHPRSNDRR